MPMGWMWAALGAWFGGRLNEGCKSAVAASSCTFNMIKNDRCGQARLSKIAHMLKLSRRINLAARWRRSQQPLASSQFSRALTLARARAMEESAAP